jgi:hypothetical protein
MLDPMLRKLITSKGVNELTDYRHEILKKRYTPICFREMPAVHPTKVPDKCRLRCGLFKQCYRDWYRRWRERQQELAEQIEKERNDLTKRRIR